MTWFEVALLILLIGGIVAAIFLPKYRKFIVITTAVLAGVLAAKLGMKKPKDPDLKEEDKPPSIPVVENPAAPIEEKVADEHDAIDALGDTGDLSDAWAAHSDRAGSSDLPNS